MEKTITKTDVMEVALFLALKDIKRLNEKLRQMAEALGDENSAQVYEKNIQTINQMMEIVRGAKWRD